MLNNKTFLAIIPARGGSKRLPRKNVLDLAGKPLIGWTIEAAKRSQYIDTIMVSSDDTEILEIAHQFGVKTIERPQEFANDTATTFDAIKHVLDNTETKYDYVILLQPTSPLRNNKHIDEAIQLLFDKQADAIISVSEMEHSPLWSNTLNDQGDMSFFVREDVKNKRSQDLETYYRLNGAIYICSTDRLLKEKTFLIKDNIFAYTMSRKTSVDIDEQLDFDLAKVLLT